jgi:FtsH-binding integral membrane protein
VEATVVEISQEDVALAELVREAQAAAAVAEQQLREGDQAMLNYPLLIALGLLFLAASFLVTHSTARTALVVLSCVAFLIAVILTLVGTAGVPGGG